MFKIHSRLTVGELRFIIDKLPAHAEVLIDFQTEYDGEAVERSGAATWAGDTKRNGLPSLLIDATQEPRN